MKKSFKKKLNLIAGTVFFIFLLGSAFAVDWIFGVGFLVGFFIAVYNGLAEKNPLIPLFLFIGALIIRIGLGFIPSLLEEENIISLVLSLVIIVTFLIAGYRIKNGKWKIWEFSFGKFFRSVNRKEKRIERKTKRRFKKK